MMPFAKCLRSPRLAVLLLSAAMVVASACGTRSPLKIHGSGSGAEGGAGGQATTTTTTSTTTSGGGGSTPTETRFRLGFISDVPESIWVNETDPAWVGGHWLTIFRGSEALRKSKACEICACDDCPNCPVCGAPCPTAIEVQSGGSVEWAWSGLEFPAGLCPSSPQESCLERVTAAAGSYTARFCWGPSFTGTPPCPAEVVDVQCAEVSFQHPDPDGLVEYLVNNSG